MSHVNHHHPSRDLLANRLHFDFGRIFTFFNELAKRRRHRRELNHVLIMPDYLLKDIGVTRGDVARGLAERLS
jgi:uncharacterized protein YjiS (DUF1127 family)